MRRNKKYFFFFISFLSAALAIGGLGISLYSIVRDLPNPERITERAVVESTKIFDRTGTTLLYEIHGEEKRTVISLHEIPQRVVDATIAAEDINFYKHGGIDPRGILRAFIKNIQRGDISQGGSTITQQLVKNSILTNERTYTRKLKEAILAVLIEHRYSKSEILSLYLNQIPYGANAYGIAAASQTYFGKEVKNLTTREAATLAALPKAPTYYSPHGSHKEELQERIHWILDRMAEANFINTLEVKTAKNESVLFLPPKQSIRAPHFVMYVREYLNEKFGEGFVEKGGLKVTTTLDWKLQEEAEKIVREGAEENEKRVEASNAALIALDPKTGEVLAMVGSRDYWESPKPDGCTPGVNCKFDPHVNVTIRPRQPGSAFKPFVYATAFKKGYTPKTVLFDAQTEFNPLCNPDGTPGPLIQDEKDCYHPRNYDGNFRGPVSLRQALAQSLNLPSVKLLYLAGVEDSIKTAQAMGLSTLTDPQRYGLSLVLGGAEVTLLEMVSSFGAFSQDGILHPKIAIIKIENSNGVILEEKKDQALPVIDTEIARTINDVLSDNEARIPIFNPQSSLFFPGRRVAAKTGTTQDYRDAWVVGYTPSIVAGVWVGNNDNAPMHQSSVSVMVAGPLWHKFMNLVLSKVPPEEFPAPEYVSSEKPFLRGLWRRGEVVKIDTISKKLATQFTPPELVEEISTGGIASILATVKKEDPLGPQPENPSEDPQFKNWQEGIERWVTSHGLPSPEAPKEYDDLHTQEKRPRISFSSRNIAGSVLTELSEIKILVDAKFPLKEVSLFIGDELIDSKTSPIFSSEISFPLKKKLSPGSYRVRISAYDVVGNKETREEIITVTAPVE